MTLAIGVVTTMFTAYTVTQSLIEGWFKLRRPKTLRVNILESCCRSSPRYNS